MLTALFMTVLQTSLASGFIVLVMVVFSARLNKIFAAKWKFWVWLLLAARLLIPVNFSIARAPLRLSVPDARLSDSHQAQVTPGAAASHSLTVIELAALIWFAGMIMFLLYHFIIYRICGKKTTRWSYCTKNAALLSSLNSVRSESGVRKNITLLICPEISGPMIIGFFNSRLLLPSEDYTASEMNYIAKHELIHIKRRDIWYKLILLLANAAHWFNPVMYFMRCEAGKDLELACDDEVVKGLTFDAKIEYSDMILKSIDRQCSRNEMLAASFHGGANVIKERFANILSKNKKRAGIFPGAVAVSCVLLTGALVTCDRSGLIALAPFEHYHITSSIEDFPVKDIFISLPESQKGDIKDAAARFIEDVAKRENFELPDYFDQYFFIRKLKDENAPEQPSERSFTENTSSTDSR